MPCYLALILSLKYHTINPSDKYAGINRCNSGEMNGLSPVVKITSMCAPIVSRYDSP